MGNNQAGKVSLDPRKPILLKPARYRAEEAGANRTEGAKALRQKRAWAV